MKHIAVVTFKSGIREGWKPNAKKYNFLTDMGDLKKGDELLVQTKHGVQVVTFVKYDNTSYITETGKKKAHKWVVGKL